jgi:cell division protein FtsB
MIRETFARLAKSVSDILQHPLRVFAISLALVVAGLVLDGSLFRLWRLDRDTTDILSRIEVLKSQTHEIDQKIKRARDPNFIEIEAREKFDLASEGDLVFVFSDEE